MLSEIFLKKFRKHRKYLYISIFLIAGYFLGSALITPKITLVAEELLEDIIKENISSKKSSITSEFNRFNVFLKYAEDLINNATSNPSETPIKELKEKLLFISELARSADFTSNNFIYFITPKGIEEVHFANKDKLFNIPPVPSFSKEVKSLKDEILIDTVITSHPSVINRKIYAKKINPETTVVVGYDINLFNFWKHYTKTSTSGSGYTVVTNLDGICLLHPEIDQIGKKLDGFFDKVSIENILQHNNQDSLSLKRSSKNVLEERTTSQFLGLEVLRYFEVIKVGDSSLILIESFPTDINLKEATEKMQDYFSWISLLAFLIFILLLLLSRVQLKKEYKEKLSVFEEKKKLVVANEKYQKENAVLQLDKLKKKMNPHFLFNSLNSLHVLIESKPDVSQEFVFRLAEVYRYLLESKEGDLTKVRNEINFLEQYIYLQEIRFKSSLKVFIINTCENLILHKKIPFLSLQTLVENAIKHNQITKDNPLHIKIIIKQNVILVLNNYNPRKHKDANSHYLGLKYLEKIYRHHQTEAFKAEIVKDNFQCTLPLIS